MQILYSSDCLNYEQPGHPESPERIIATVTHLDKMGCTFTEPMPCGDEDILEVHTPELLEEVKNGTFFDFDTPAFPGIYQIAKLSAGAGIGASQAALTDGSAFSLIRPPGHHATKTAVMGFCYFNNIAIAAAHYLRKNPTGKVAILDIDCHHGNGTEDIFLNNPSVLYISLHQVPLFPGTGLRSNSNSISYPLSPGTEEPEYLSTLKNACALISDFNPDLIGVSAGFDTYRNDPLSYMQLDITTYGKIGAMIRNLNKPAFHILEGGYSTDLPLCIHEYITGFEK